MWIPDICFLCDAVGKPMKKERKKRKWNWRTTLTVWTPRTEGCSVAQLPRRTKHILRRQKVMVVASFPPGCAGSGPAALHRACDASGMTWCSLLHFLWCTSIVCWHTRLLREQFLLSVMPNCLSLSGHLTSLSKGKTKKVCQNTSFGLPCLLPSQLLSCSVIFPVLKNDLPLWNKLFLFELFCVFIIS
jgi:hypothetical protein